MPITLMAVSRAAQKPALTIGFSPNLNTGDGSAWKTSRRTHHNRTSEADTAAQAGTRRNTPCRQFPNAETGIPEQHEAEQNRGILLGEHAGGSDGEQGYGSDLPTAIRHVQAANIKQQAPEDGHGRQQVRAARDIRDGVAAGRVHGPQRSREEGRPRAPDQPPGQCKHQPHVAQVQEEIEPSGTPWRFRHFPRSRSSARKNLS